MTEEGPPAAAASTPPEMGREYATAFDKLVSLGFTPTDDGARYTCPRCGKASRNPRDLEHRYCGACNWSEDWGERPQ